MVAAPSGSDSGTLREKKKVLHSFHWRVIKCSDGRNALTSMHLLLLKKFSVFSDTAVYPRWAAARMQSSFYIFLLFSFENMLYLSFNLSFKKVCSKEVYLWSSQTSHFLYLCFLLPSSCSKSPLLIGKVAGNIYPLLSHHEFHLINFIP